MGDGQYMTYRVLYGKSRINAEDLLQLCRAINMVEMGHGFKVLIFHNGRQAGSGLYSRSVPFYLKCIAPLVFWVDGDEIGAAIGLGSQINKRATAIVAYLKLQARLTWSAEDASTTEEE